MSVRKGESCLGAQVAPTGGWKGRVRCAYQGLELSCSGILITGTKLSFAVSIHPPIQSRTLRLVSHILFPHAAYHSSPNMLCLYS